MPTRVYQYGLLLPRDGADEVRAQLRAAHNYRNTLIEIERHRRAAQRDALAAGPDVEAAAKADAEAAVLLETALQDLKRARANVRARKVDGELAAAVKKAKAARKVTAAALRAARRARTQDPEMVARRESIDALATELRRGARALCGVYWGTYALVEAAMDAASKAPLYEFGEANDPRFVRWTGEGQVAVHIAHGKPPEYLFEENTLVRIAPVDPRAYTAPSRGDRGRFARTTLSLRVTSAERAPVWTTWPMVMHRPLPPAALVKRVVVSCRKVADREVWSVEITVQVPEPQALGERKAAVAVDLGWRVVGDELRVGTWAGGDGERGEIRLSAAELAALHRPETLRATRDANFNAAKTTLLAHLPTLQAPAWLLDAAAHLPQWRSTERFARLIERWMAHGRIPGDEVEVVTTEPPPRPPPPQRSPEERAARRAVAIRYSAACARWDAGDPDGALASVADAPELVTRLATREVTRGQPIVGRDRSPRTTSLYKMLVAWREHDLHLWRWEASSRQRALRRRREVYRRAAAMLATRYGALVLEDFDLRAFARYAPAEAARDDAAPARGNRQLAAPSELRRLLEEAFAARGGEQVRDPPENTTRDCNACHARNVFDASVAIRHQCTACGVEWDQDDNAALNLLARWRARGTSAVVKAAEPTGSKWVRRKAKVAA